MGGLLVRRMFCLQADGSIAGMAYKMWGAYERQLTGVQIIAQDWKFKNNLPERHQDCHCSSVETFLVSHLNVLVPVIEQQTVKM